MKRVHIEKNRMKEIILGCSRFLRISSPHRARECEMRKCYYYLSFLFFHHTNPFTVNRTENGPMIKFDHIYSSRDPARKRAIDQRTLLSTMKSQCKHKIIICDLCRWTTALYPITVKNVVSQRCWFQQN